jgi:hypothetical protein
VSTRAGETTIHPPAHNAPQATRAGGRFGPPKRTYAHLSTRPLHILVLLLPLVAFYELGSVLWLRQATDAGGVATEDIKARQLLAQLFEHFGMVGLYVPAILTIVVLAIWHVLLRDPWRVRPGVVGAMVLEAALLTIPLLVLGRIVYAMLVGDGGPPAAAVATANATLPFADSLGARLTIAVGAGLYEELLFRLIGITLVHLLLVDVLGLSDKAGAVAAVVLTSIAFALYHDQSFTGGLDPGHIAYFFAAGLYFAGVYMLRGFGIAVLVHVLYDIVVLQAIAG